ncbi:MAG: hypothetical protein Q4B84_01685 [Clostridia bacterium]|nr:hypothetical protein [Clostridia bacterium]
MMLISMTKWFIFIFLALFGLIAFSNDIAPKQPKELFEKERNWGLRFFASIIVLIIFLIAIS